MPNRRNFIKLSLTSLSLLTACQTVQNSESLNFEKPIVVSTWDSGLRANAAAWKVLEKNGRALDAVEEAAKYAEIEPSCCVGLSGNPDRDGFVTLDASIMDENSNCGSVAFLENIKHPISVARKLMETTPHVLLVGAGAEKFALENGFEKMPQKLSEDAQKDYQKWLKESKYQPQINIENQKPQNQTSPMKLANGEPNHDTMGTIALDSNGNLSGACTTSGMAFKMRGRVGDSPIIGAGLYVDNEIGAATTSGLGEEVIKNCGTFLVVELMRQGLSPENACKEAINRIVKRNPEKAKTFQVGFIAISKKGEVGAFAIQKGFSYSITNSKTNKVLQSKSYFQT